MIKYESNKGMLSLIAKGSMRELLADIYELVHQIYCDMDDKSAKVFEEAFLNTSEVCFMSEEEIDADIKERLGGDDTKKKLDELIDALENLLKHINGDNGDEA